MFVPEEWMRMLIPKLIAAAGTLFGTRTFLGRNHDPPGESYVV